MLFFKLQFQVRIGPLVWAHQAWGTKILSWKKRIVGGVKGQPAKHQPRVPPEAGQQPWQKYTNPAAFVYLHLRRVVGKGHLANK